MNTRSLALMLSLCAIGPLALAAGAAETVAKPVLRVGMVGGLAGSLERFVPVLSRQLGQPVQLTVLGNLELFNGLQSEQPPYDVAIGSITREIEPFLTAQWVDMASIMPVVQSRVVLWCPAPNVAVRTSPEQTLRQPAVKRVAIARRGGTVARLVEANVNIPPNVTLVHVPHSQAAWKMAQKGQAECAFIMTGLLQPNNFLAQPIRNSTFNLTGVISRHTQQPQTARRLLDLLRTSAWQMRLRNVGFEPLALSSTDYLLKSVPALPR